MVLLLTNWGVPDADLDCYSIKFKDQQLSVVLLLTNWGAPVADLDCYSIEFKDATADVVLERWAAFAARL